MALDLGRFPSLCSKDGGKIFGAPKNTQLGVHFITCHSFVTGKQC